MTAPKGLTAEEASRCDEAIELLSTADDLPPADLIERMDAVEEKAVTVRDSLIERLRAGIANGSPEPVLLQRINLCLSLLAAVEYPGSIQRSRIGEARQVLQELVGKQAPSATRRKASPKAGDS